MPTYRLQIVSSDAWPACGEAWDDLWDRSRTTQPTVTSRGLSLWRQSFAERCEFRALTVRDGDALVAGLPLIARRVGKLVPIWTLPTNSSVNAGDVLIDPGCRRSEALALLADGLSQLPGSFAIFDEIEMDAPRWRQFLDVLGQKGCAVSISQHNSAGVVDILHDWDRYTQSWSGNHRSAVKRCLKKLDKEGPIRIERIQSPDDAMLEDLLANCFEIEHRSWKGDHGTSILAVPGMREYYLAEARMVRDYGMLDLWVLKLADKIIAFEYCHFSKGTCFSHKLSFEPEYARFSPGRVLRYHQLRGYHDDPSARLFDMLGELCRSKASWATRKYATGRCIIATGGGLSQAILRGYRRTKPVWGKLRSQQLEVIDVGAARYLEGVAAACPPPSDAAHFETHRNRDLD